MTDLRSDLDAALAILKDWVAAHDVYMTDYDMPTEDITACADRARNLLADKPIAGWDEFSIRMRADGYSARYPDPNCDHVKRYAISGMDMRPAGWRCEDCYGDFPIRHFPLSTDESKP